jgi:peptidoglycan/xylan/chitin deacetylase (PgdA/CDA1 family)
VLLVSCDLSVHNDTIVLCYHAVSPSWPIGLAIRPERLGEHVSSLLSRGYRPATFYDAVVSPREGKIFAVTFDDGFRSVLEHGYPVLSKLDVSATVFAWPVAVDAQDEPVVGPVLEPYRGTAHHHELFSMSWDELRRLRDAGWEIGSHAMSHPYLTRLDEAALDWELQASRERLEAELGVPCRTLAYPSGDYDQRVVAATARAGYAAACTLPQRFPATPQLLEWPRVSFQREDSMRTFRTKVSPTVRRLRRSALWPLAERARSLTRRG